MPDTERYSRQVLLPAIGPQGQEKLAASCVLVLGCGALGSVAADALARAGVGRLLLADRDFVELSNLQRQVLYDEQDVADRLPKAEAAARRLRRVNSDIALEAQVADLGPGNIESLLKRADLCVDGTDNVETRYVLNDACVELGKPWIYGGAVGTEGLAMAILPGHGPCLRCAFPEPPPTGSLQTCDTAGVLGTLPLLVAALQATEAIKLLLGERSGVGRLRSVDAWRGRFSSVTLPRDAQCPCCARGERSFLTAQATSWVTSLCGRNAVQVTPPEPARLDLEQLARSLSRVGQVSCNGLLLTLQIDGHELIVFADGRAMVKGTSDGVRARSLVARYVGL